MLREMKSVGPGGSDPLETASPSSRRPYFYPPPEPVPFWRGVSHGIRRWAKEVGDRWRHTFRPYDQVPQPDRPITPEDPEGQITEEQLRVCKHVAEREASRTDKLEQKSTVLVSVVAVVAPLAISTLVYLAGRPSLDGIARWLTVGLLLLALLLFLASFVAGARALAVKGHDELHLQSVIDLDKESIREFDCDFFGRGLLVTTSRRQALNAHVADFVRGAHMFLMTGVALVLLAGLPVLWSEFFRGTDQSTPEERIGTAVGDRLERVHKDLQMPIISSLDRVESELDSIRTLLEASASDVTSDSLRRSPSGQ